MPKSVTVFCGSSLGTSNVYKNTARELGEQIAKLGLRLVYGGAHVGLMGVMADTALSCGAEVIGVMPRQLYDREIGHTGLTELLIVGSMHERKFKMAELGDIYLAMPGGFGTLDEFFEIVTWSQIGLHTKACVLLNANGFYNDLITWIDHATAQGFIKREHRDMIIIGDDAEAVLRRAIDYEHRVQPKWSAEAAVES